MKNKLLLVLAGLSILLFALFSCSKDMPTTNEPVDEYAKNQATEPGHVNVLIGYEGAKATDAITAVEGKVKHEYRNFSIVFASIPEDAISTLASKSGIRYVEKDIVRHYYTQTLDWGVDRIDAEYVHDSSSYTGDGVDVAIIDSGGDQDHPDLTWAGGYNFYGADTTDWDDDDGHGTHCAGIISADDNTIGVEGVAPEADVWALRVGASDPYLSLILEAADWCIDNDIKVISMSYGGSYSSAEDDAMEDCYDAGILLVAAAGNSYGDSVGYPAALSTVMAISASNSSDGFAYYSSQGSEVELIAPGSSIYSTYPGGTYTTMSGTSMACPMVAGVAALAWEANSGYTNTQIRSLLQSTAEDIGLSSSQQGYGLVDAENATLGTTYGDDYENADTMHVNYISFSQQRTGRYYTLYIYVNIHDEACTNPVSSAYVNMTLYHHGGSNYYFSGYTNASGTVTFGITGASQGMTFTATVTDVTKDGWYYNSASNHETSDTYTIQ